MTDGTDPTPMLPIAGARETARALRALVATRRGLAFAAFVTLLASAGAALAVPPLLGAIVNVAVDGGSTADLAGPVAGLVLAAVVQALVGGVGVRLVATLGERILASLREQVLDRALTIPTVQLDRTGRGDLLSRISNDVAAVSDAVREMLPAFTRALLLVGLTGIGLAALDWRLALAAAVALPIHVVGLRWYLRNVVPVYRRERIAEGVRTEQLLTAIAGAKTARTLGLGAARLEDVRASSADAAGIAMHAARLQGTRFLPALNGAELAGLTAVLATGYWLVSDGAITVGAATAAALYFHRAFDPVGELLFLFDDLQDALSSLGRLVGIADLPVPDDVPARTGTRVSVAGVGHSYVTGHAVLDDVDLDIAPGEHVAVVGTSGAGKTTLARIVAGVLEPTRGRVRIGEEHPHASAALVAQEVHVFAGTLADDLRLAAPGADDARLHAALARVGATWVDGLPHGLETVVGDRRASPRPGPGAAARPRTARPARSGRRRPRRGDRRGRQRERTRPRGRGRRGARRPHGARGGPPADAGAGGGPHPRDGARPGRRVRHARGAAGRGRSLCGAVVRMGASAARCRLAELDRRRYDADHGRGAGSGARRPDEVQDGAESGVGRQVGEMRDVLGGAGHEGQAGDCGDRAADDHRKLPAAGAATYGRGAELQGAGDECPDAEDGERRPGVGARRRHRERDGRGEADEPVDDRQDPCRGAALPRLDGGREDVDERVRDEQDRRGRRDGVGRGGVAAERSHEPDRPGEGRDRPHPGDPAARHDHGSGHGERVWRCKGHGGAFRIVRERTIVLLSNHEPSERQERSFFPLAFGAVPRIATLPPVRHSEPRARLLAKASELFYREGVNSVGVDRIVSEAGVTRATFYRHFPGKQDLVLAYLQGAHDVIEERMAVALAMEDPRARLRALGEDIADQLLSPGFGGCAFIKVASEFDDPDEPVRRAVRRTARGSPRSCGPPSPTRVTCVPTTRPGTSSCSATARWSPATSTGPSRPPRPSREASTACFGTSTPAA